MRERLGEGFELRRVYSSLGEGGMDVLGAAREWENSFGIERKGAELDFLGGITLRFMGGKEGAREGNCLVSIAFEVRSRLDYIFDKAQNDGSKMIGETNFVMLSIVWEFYLLTLHF
ncbi:hypothetical protein ACMFMF_006759 [Clarireedia jacksonii]